MASTFRLPIFIMELASGRKRADFLYRKSIGESQLEGFAVGALVHSRICFVGAHGDAVQGAVILIGTMVGALLNSAFDGRICFAGLTGHREVLLQILQIHPVPAAGAGGTRRLKEAESACFSRRI